MSSSPDGELDHDECLRLLSSHRVGRVVFTDNALPAVEPIVYVLDHDEVVFAVERTSTLATVRDTVVGFQVDEIDPGTGAGWSVLGVGTAYEVTAPQTLGRVVADSRALPDVCILAVPLQRVTGHETILRVVGAGTTAG